MIDHNLRSTFTSFQIIGIIPANPISIPPPDKTTEGIPTRPPMLIIKITSMQPSMDERDALNNGPYSSCVLVTEIGLEFPGNNTAKIRDFFENRAYLSIFIKTNNSNTAWNVKASESVTLIPGAPIIL